MIRAHRIYGDRSGEAGCPFCSVSIKQLAAARRSIHQKGADAHTHTGACSDGVDYKGITMAFDKDCGCMDLPCAQANLFIYIIAGLEGNGKRFLIQAVVGHPWPIAVPRVQKNIHYTGITSSEKVEIAKNFTIDFNYDQHSQIVKD